MSQAIVLRNFTLCFTAYAIISLILYVGASLFSLLAQLIGLWILLPFYIACILRLLVSLSNGYTTVKYYKFLILFILGFQLITILCSPTVCYGFHEQDGCYPLIQVLLSKDNLHGYSSYYSNRPADWTLADNIFPIALVFYLVSIVAFLASIQMQKPANR